MMQGQRFTEKDWKLFRKKAVDWQEAHMDKLNKEYIELLSRDMNWKNVSGKIKKAQEFNWI